MKKYSAIFFVIFLLTLPFSGTGLASQNPAMPSAFARDINKFSLNLVRNSGLLNKRSVLLSPFGIYSNLLSLSNLTTKTNKDQIEATLYADNALHTTKDFAQLRQSFEHYFRQADAIWVQQPGSIQNTNEPMPSAIFYLDFSQSKQLSTELINQWVKKQLPQGKEQALNPEMLAKKPAIIITSLTTLNANWLFPFKHQNTTRQAFHPTAKNTVQAQFMHQEHYFPYYKDKNFSLTVLPYENQQLALAVIIPKNGLSPGDLLTNLKAEIFSLYLSKTHYKNLDLKLLKKTFVGTPIFLSQTLQKLGLSDLFKPASYPQLSRRRSLQLSNVAQINKFSLTENGSGRRDVTVTASDPIQTDPIQMDKAVPFYTNRPFALILYDLRSQVILLAGVVNRP